MARRRRRPGEVQRCRNGQWRGRLWLHVDGMGRQPFWWSRCRRIPHQDLGHRDRNHRIRQQAWFIRRFSGRYHPRRREHRYSQIKGGEPFGDSRGTLTVPMRCTLALVLGLGITPAIASAQQDAFKDPQARTLLERARVARLKQDSTLGAYDANTYFRMSIGMGVRRTGLEKLFFRTEQSARVQWSRTKGLWVQPTGRRSAFPLGKAEADMAEATPIPFFPGRESLWAPGSGITEVAVDEEEMLHPLAEGAEAHYFFASGD